MTIFTCLQVTPPPQTTTQVSHLNNFQAAGNTFTTFHFPFCKVNTLKLKGSPVSFEQQFSEMKISIA